MKMPKVEKILRDLIPHLGKVSSAEVAALITDEVTDSVRAVLKQIKWNDRKTMGLNFGFCLESGTMAVKSFSIEDKAYIYEYTLGGKFVSKVGLDEFYDQMNDSNSVVYTI